MGKPAIYGTPASKLPPQKHKARDVERYERLYKRAPTPTGKKSK
jgi:hypothetical protein